MVEQVVESVGSRSAPVEWQLGQKDWKRRGSRTPELRKRGRPTPQRIHCRQPEVSRAVPHMLS